MRKKKINNYIYEETKNNGISFNVKMVTFVVLFLFFILFQKYSPFVSPTYHETSLVEQIFGLYHFVINQTLGIVHEGGHGICYILPCPEWFMVLNGTLFQLLFPLGIAYYYKRKKDFFVVFIALFFVGFSLYSTSWYISTANEGLYLPASKSFLGVDAYHDFNYLLSKIGALDYYLIIAGFTKFIAYMVMIISLFGMLLTSFSTTKE